MSVSIPVHAEELCMDGTLLFREDFGGNDPDDPVAGVDPAPGMTSSYMQIFDTATCNGRYPCTGMGSGRYLLTKVGYRNSAGYSYSHWYIMDDHTYPNDYTRGYLLEIDGRTDNATLFETVIDGLCEGSRLTFSAYVVNVTTSHSYDYDHNNGDPQLSFLLVDPETGAELTTPYKTGPIPVERSFQDLPAEWRYSAHWHLVGMNFTVPVGKTAVKLIIKNACTAFNGNDFAIDDIEIRLCAPPVTIEGETEVCENTATTLHAAFTNEGTFPEPLEYKWWHSEDSVTWTELSETTDELSLPTIQKTDSGWYKVAVAGAGNIESVNCRAVSEPFLLQPVYCPPTYYTITCDTAVCHEDSVFFRGRTYAAPGIYIDTVFTPTGRDTISQLTVSDSRSFKEFAIIITAGNPPPHPWEHITESGVYRDTLVNAAGCDSIVTCHISFKERCIESQEEYHSFCAGDAYEWNGREYRDEGDYRDTLWHKQEEACDTAVLLHLKMLPTYGDTTVAVIRYGETYEWEDGIWSEPTEQTRRYTAANGCDSLCVLQLAVDYSLTVDQLDLEYGCGDNERLRLLIRLSRPVDTVRIRFPENARTAGLRDTAVYMHGKEADILIPHRGAKPGTFTCEVALVHGMETLHTAAFAFTLLYPASVLEQAWNDVVAVLTHDYNGGYDFVAFQWYENGKPLTGETGSYLYKPLIMGGEYSALLTEADGTQSMTCPLIATLQTDVSLYPVVNGPHRVIRCHLSEEAELWLYDALGRMIGHAVVPAGETEIPAPRVTGVCIARIVTRADRKEHPYKLILR